jgi:alpha-glucosidase (family GH31 glycosyl hydrolase)
MPMYYIDKSAEAYKAKNQYYFGSELLVAPVVEKCKNDGFAYVKVYLPKGRWTDFFTGKVYIGGQVYTVATPLNRMPVFAKEGAIIPMLKTRNGNSTDFDELEVRVYPGNNKYRMFDEGGYTDFEVCEVDEGYVVKIDDEFAPVKAEITVEFVGDKTQKVLLKKGQKEIFFKR